jgi:hypothetical protein
MSLLPFPQFNSQPEKILAILWARESLLNGTRFTMGANCYINELTHGRRYFFRASSGNIKGWGEDPKSQKFGYFQYSKLMRLILAISTMTICG